MFFMTINKFKPNTPVEEIGKIIPSHIQWVKKKIAEEKIAQAGKWGDAGGMVIFKTETIDDATNLVNEDPLVQSGLITYELAQFYPDVEVTEPQKNK